MLKIKQQKAIVCVWGSFQMKSCIHWILIGSFSPWHVSWCELSIEWTAAVKMAPAKSQGIHRKLKCSRLQHKPLGPSFNLRHAWLFLSKMSINIERCQALWVNLLWVEQRHFAGWVCLSKSGKSFSSGFLPWIYLQCMHEGEIWKKYQCWSEGCRREAE